MTFQWNTMNSPFLDLNDHLAAQDPAQLPSALAKTLQEAHEFFKARQWEPAQARYESVLKAAPHLELAAFSKRKLLPR